MIYEIEKNFINPSLLRSRVGLLLETTFPCEHNPSPYISPPAAASRWSERRTASCLIRATLWCRCTVGTLSFLLPTNGAKISIFQFQFQTSYPLQTCAGPTLNPPSSRLMSRIMFLPTVSARNGPIFCHWQRDNTLWYSQLITMWRRWPRRAWVWLTRDFTWHPNKGKAPT